LNFNIFNSIILAGIIQGFVFAGIWLFNKKYRAKSTYILITLIVVYSLSNLQFYLLDIGVFDYVKFYDLYYIPLALLMPPLLLLYGFSLLNAEINKRKTYLLFVPFIAVMGFMLYYKYQLVVNHKVSGYSSFLDKIPTWGEYVAIVYAIIVAAILLIKTKRVGKNTPFTLAERTPQLHWFRTIMKFQVFAITLWAVSEVLFGSSSENYYYYPLWIVLAIIIYWMGHVGMYKYGITHERKEIRKRVHESYSIKEFFRSKNDLISNLERFLVTERNFLNPQLSQEMVAEHLEISAGHLSKTINTELNQSFKEYLNKLRVEEAKSYLLNKDFSNYTLVAIGLEAGFNSKSAFNASFKKITGQTPSEFKKN
jgi:AraC-like DNA-binding protein